MGPKKINAEKVFFDSCEKEFKFLEQEFGFQLFRRFKSTTYLEIIYVNKRCGINIQFDLRDIDISLYLVNIQGQDLNSPGLFSVSDLNARIYDLESLAKLRGMSGRMEKPSADELFFKSDSEIIIQNVIKQAANILKKYGREVLNGDFSVFE